MLKLATINDLEALNQLINSAYRGETSKKGWTTEEHLLGGIRTDINLLRGIIESRKNSLYKYEVDNQIIGTVLLEKKGDALYLGMLTVNPLLQGAGIGKKIMEAAEIIAKEQSLAKMQMTVISVRTELIDFYKRRGYVDTGKKEPFPMEDRNFGEPKQFLEFIVMEKDLIQ
jgi:ribosomal protein S18 acetylase RimI-like enzyme